MIDDLNVTIRRPDGTTVSMNLGELRALSASFSLQIEHDIIWHDGHGPSWAERGPTSVLTLQVKLKGVVSVDGAQRSLPAPG